MRPPVSRRSRLDPAPSESGCALAAAARADPPEGMPACPDSAGSASAARLAGRRIRDAAGFGRTLAPSGFELSNYEHCDFPLIADLQEVVAGKLIAMRGPQSVADGAMYEDVSRRLVSLPYRLRSTVNKQPRGYWSKIR